MFLISLSLPAIDLCSRSFWFPRFKKSLPQYHLPADDTCPPGVGQALNSDLIWQCFGIPIKLKQISIFMFFLSLLLLYFFPSKLSKNALKSTWMKRTGEHDALSTGNQYLLKVSPMKYPEWSISSFSGSLWGAHRTLALKSPGDHSQRERYFSVTQWLCLNCVLQLIFRSSLR